MEHMIAEKLLEIALKKEYGLSIKELKKQAIKAYQYEMDFEEQ